MLQQSIHQNSEELFPIVGYEEKYSITKSGKVFSKKLHKFNGKGKFLKWSYNGNGYPTVLLYKNSIHKRLLVHRLVASTFIKKVDGKNWINHIDANPSNSHISNLEWCTPSENSQHAYNIGRRDHTIDGMRRRGKNASKFAKEANKKAVLDKNTGIKFSSIKEASEFYGVDSSGLGKAIKGLISLRKLPNINMEFVNDQINSGN